MGRREVVAALFFCVLLFVYGGCQRRRSVDVAVDTTGMIPSDVRKAQLLENLDRRWENPDAHFELGQLYHADGLWSKAEHCYNTAVSFDPAHRDAQAATVKVLLDSGDRTRSQITAELYVNQASSSASSLLALGLGFQRQGMDEYALGCYKQALAMAPNSAKINRQIGYYYLAKKNIVLAKEYLTRSFQLDANQPDVAGELGRLGVAVRIPRGPGENPEKLDRMVDEADRRIK